MANNDDKKNRSIDVTKPQKPSSQTNIDASRVSAYTLREQQSLDKLKKQVGNLNQKENRASNIKTIAAIILVVMLLILAVLFIIIIGRGSSVEEEIQDMRLSVQIENKSTFSVITEVGQEQLREINPGDRVPLRASVRNSKDIRGDAVEEGTNITPIYVRFKIVLVLDYEERYDIIVPTMSDRWCKYDPETEPLNGVKVDDHYYYLLGSLRFMEAEELFSEILFDGNVITCDDGGKYGQVQVLVDCIPAQLDTVINRQFWQTAPQAWINKLNQLSNTGSGSVESE